MKILFLCHRFPYPPRSGDKIRAFHMIRHLARRNEVTVASLVRTAEEEREAAGLASICARYEVGKVSNVVQAARMVARLPTLVPSSMGYFYSRVLDAKVTALLNRERFDLILVHCSSVAQYVEAESGTPMILDFADMDSQKWLEYARFKPFPLSLGYWLEGTKLERAERRLARRFDLCTTITRAELATLESYGTGAAADWFPNGVDIEYFTPSDEPYERDSICFVGRMNYYPNVECMAKFCENVLPLVRAQRPGVKLYIVGADPSPEVRKLGDMAGVEVTGSVPDVRPYLHRSALMIAPLNIARGTQNKILEAMSAGVPVVTSRLAAGGVDAVADEHFLVAETAQEHSAAILRILEDPTERSRLAAAGRTRMLTNHTWEVAMRRLDGIIERCLAEYRPPEPSRSLARSGTAR